MNITELEKQVLSNIVNSEYMGATSIQMIDWAIWSFSATNENKQLAGALGSLVKKGLCFSDDEDNDPICGLTEQGYYIAKKLLLL